MISLYELAIANMWNRFLAWKRPGLKGGFVIGFLIIDGRVTRKVFYVPTLKRAEHFVIIGKTGSGKTYLIRSMAAHDIEAEHGFICFDFHGDQTPFQLSTIAEEQQRTGKDLASRLILISPGDPKWSVGLNVLSGSDDEHDTFVRVGILTAILKERWGMEHFGPRTEELLRNCLFVLAASRNTLVDLAAFLVDAGFRTECLRLIGNSDVKEYFQLRFEPLSPAMKAVVRDPILNKVFEFVSDPIYKCILGQRQSTFSFDDVLDTGKIVLVDLNKGKLGRHSATLGSLILAMFGFAVFRRKRRDLFTVYADEVQNLFGSNTDFDTYLSEFRKFGVSLCLATQIWSHFPKSLQSAATAIGTHLFFQLSSEDAQTASAMLDGGRPLQELLKKLPPGQLIAKTGHHRWRQLQVPKMEFPRAQYSALVQRSRELYATPIHKVLAEIQKRRARVISQTEVLDDWE